MIKLRTTAFATSLTIAALAPFASQAIAQAPHHPLAASARDHMAEACKARGYATVEACRQAVTGGHGGGVTPLPGPTVPATPPSGSATGATSTGASALPAGWDIRRPVG